MRNPVRPVLLVALLTVAAGCNKPATPPATTAAPAATPAAPAPAPAAQAPAPAAAPQTVFRREELDQMVAPIALYPDELLAQVLMASTYPGDVADAVAWSKANPNAKGDDAVRQAGSQPWDPSVQALVAFPQALTVLGQDPGWVQRLGDAFLAQPGDVMDAVQRLRQKAQTAGNLQTNEYQRVSMEPAPPAPAPAVGGVIEQAPAQTIIIEAADPEVVYVPSYNPTEVYGSWDYPAYPPPYYPPSPYWYPGSALMTGLAWGTGIAIAGSLWGDMDWGGDDIDIDVDRYNSINTNRQINRGDNNWQHNAINRDGVPYRDNANRERHGRQLDDSARRDSFRGDDPARARSREAARSQMQSRGIEPARDNRQARDQAQRASRDMRDNAGSQGRDAQRDQAARTARDRSQGQARDQQRQRAAQTARDRPQQTRDRQQAGQGARDRQGGQGQGQRQRSQSNSQARDSARRQQQSRSQGSRNNAFEGAREPSRSRAQSERGRSSHASSQRSSGSRGGGSQVSRQSRSPQRQGGGSRSPQRQGGGRR